MELPSLVWKTLPASRGQDERDEKVSGRHRGWVMWERGIRVNKVSVV